jgi:hypothetical protein
VVFDFLSRHLPESLATILLGLWYALLLWAIFFSLGAPDALFRYWWI